MNYKYTDKKNDTRKQNMEIDTPYTAVIPSKQLQDTCKLSVVTVKII